MKRIVALFILLTLALSAAGASAGLPRNEQPMYGGLLYLLDSTSPRKTPERITTNSATSLSANWMTELWLWSGRRAASLAA